MEMTVTAVCMSVTDLYASDGAAAAARIESRWAIQRVG